jgi:hypothetical protein
MGAFPQRLQRGYPSQTVRTVPELALDALYDAALQARRKLVRHVCDDVPAEKSPQPFKHDMTSHSLFADNTLPSANATSLFDQLLQMQNKFLNAPVFCTRQSSARASRRDCSPTPSSGSTVSLGSA